MLIGVVNYQEFGKMPDVDPEKLLKDLDSRLAVLRANRLRQPEERSANRIKVMVILCVMLMLFLWGMQFLLVQMLPHRKPPPVSGPPASQESRR